MSSVCVGCRRARRTITTAARACHNGAVLCLACHATATRIAAGGDATACDACGDALFAVSCKLRSVPWEGPGADPLAAEAVEAMSATAKKARVERTFIVDNPTQEDVFEICREQFRREAKPTVTRRGFHGTTRTAAGAIARTGFDHRFTGKNGQVHGPGFYFADDAQYSCGYAPNDAQGAHCMMYVEYAPGRVGPFNQGNPGLTDSQKCSGVNVVFRSRPSRWC